MANSMVVQDILIVKGLDHIIKIIVLKCNSYKKTYPGVRVLKEER